MGYTTTFSGHVSIVPALSGPDLLKLQQIASCDQREEGPGKVPNAPGYRCQWEPSDDGSSLSWDGNEKFYNSVEWMTYLVTALGTKGYVCNGLIEAHGEEAGDIWRLSVVDNKVSAQQAKIGFDEPEQPARAALAQTRLLR